MLVSLIASQTFIIRIAKASYCYGFVTTRCAREGQTVPRLRVGLGLKQQADMPQAGLNAEAEILVNLGFTDAVQFGAEE